MNLVRAIYSGVDFNTRDMEIFLRDSVPVGVIRARLIQFPDLVPHITDARHTEIYRNRIGDLHDIADSTLKKIIHFYGLLEKIKVQVEGVQRPGYVTLTVDGRVAVIELIRSTAKEAGDVGRSILFDFRAEYPKLGLRRYVRRRF